MLTFMFTPSHLLPCLQDGDMHDHENRFKDTRARMLEVQVSFALIAHCMCMNAPREFCSLVLSLRGPNTPSAKVTFLLTPELFRNWLRLLLCLCSGYNLMLCMIHVSCNCMHGMVAPSTNSALSLRIQHYHLHACEYLVICMILAVCLSP